MLASIETRAELVSIPYQLTPTRLQEAQSLQGFNSEPSTAVINVAKLARQD
jgi:hypothetical protein